MEGADQVMRQALSKNFYEEMEGADQVMRQALSKYKYADIAKRDVKNAISHFKDLRPNYDPYIFNDGNSKHLLHLDGTIPVTYKEQPPVYSKQSKMDRSPPPYTYHRAFPFPVELQQYNLPGAISSASTAQDPIPMQGFDSGIFYQTMERFALDEFVNILVEHGVDCVETFCSMTESDLEEMGLNFGQRRKCILAAQHIKGHNLNG